MKYQDANSALSLKIGYEHIVSKIDKLSLQVQKALAPKEIETPLPKARSKAYSIRTYDDDSFSKNLHVHPPPKFCSPRMKLRIAKTKRRTNCFFLFFGESI